MIMKRIFLLIVALLVGLTLLQACSKQQVKPDAISARKVLKNEDIRAITLPGFFVRYVMLFDKELRQFTSSLKDVSSVTFALSNSSQAEIAFNRVNNKLKLNSFEDLLEVIDSDAKIAIKQRKDDNTIEEIVLLVNDDESFICMAIKGSINEDELRSLVAKFANKSKINVNPV